MDNSAAPELLARARLLPAVAAVLDRLPPEPHGRVALVGGAVRDLLLGGMPPDIDLVTEGPIDGWVALLGGDARAFERFGTASIAVAGHRVDLASARRETYDAPGALPRVAPARLEEDLERRDFTVNAIALPLTGGTSGELLAVAHAIDDLDARRLRILHVASFEDDPTRLLRLARYAARLGFTVEDATLASASVALSARALETVSGPRIGNELRLLACEQDPVAAFAMVRELAIDCAIEPEIGLRDDVWAARALELLRDQGRRDRLILALAMRRLAPARARQLLDRLAFAAEDREAIVLTGSQAPAICAAMSAANRPSQIVAAAGGASPEAVALAGALGPADHASSWLAELRHVKPLIDGNDLVAAGIPAGPAIGAGLAAARVAALDDDPDDREAQLAVALRAARLASER